MPTGRPKSKLDLPEGWQETILAKYEEGASDVEVKAWIWRQRGSYSNDLWDRWLKEEPLFSETIKLGRMLSHSWWANLGRQGALGSDEFNPTAWIFNMKNRYNWMDKKEVVTKDETEGLTKEQVDEQLMAAGIDPKKYWADRLATKH